MFVNLERSTQFAAVLVTLRRSVGNASLDAKLAFAGVKFLQFQLDFAFFL